MTTLYVPHVVQIGNRLVTIIQELITQVATDTGTESPTGSVSVSRTALLPYVSFSKSRDRETGQTRIEEGITVIPISQEPSGGTNERDDIGYRYMIAVAFGTLTRDLDSYWPLGIYPQAIRQRLNQRRIGGLTTETGCETATVVQSMKLPEWAELAEGVDATFMSVTVFLRESRRDE